MVRAARETKTQIMKGIINDKLNAIVALLASRMKAPSARGISRRKENFAAFFGGIPRNIPVEIVIPDLEIPGKRARI